MRFRKWLWRDGYRPWCFFAPAVRDGSGDSMLFTRLRSSRCGSNAPLFDETVYEHATIALPSREGDRFWPGGGNQKETAHNPQASPRGGERLRDAMPRMVQKRCPSSVAEPVKANRISVPAGHARQAAPSRRLQA